MTVGTYARKGSRAASVALALGLLTLGAAQAETLAPGLSVGGVAVGGLSPEEAVRRVGAQAGATASPVTIELGSARWKTNAAKLGLKPDPEASVAEALRLTQARSWWEKVQARFGRVTPREVPLKTKVDTAQTRRVLEGVLAGRGTAPKDATVGFDARARRYAVLTPDVPGRRPDVSQAVARFAAQPRAGVLNVPMTTSPARYTAAALQRHVDRGNALMRPLTIRLSGADRAGGLSPLQVANLYWVRPEGVVVDEKTLRGAFDSLTYQLDQPAQNARYGWRGGKWVKIGEKTGHVTQKEAAYKLFRTAVLDPEQRNVSFPSQKSEPTLRLANLPDPARLQLIAEGRSTYYGSSPERRANVANAATKVDGAVVAAGEDFSFLQALGGITAENGFVGGLIISGGRTVDGLGGGVCQVSTTTFRALYSAGLPITERNQHSYRVRYYEPQVGFEAAVYDPGLDLKMKNDTGAPILVRALNSNATSELRVQVWGVKPARQVTVSPAVILSRTAHPPAQYVFNPKLPAGSVKQVDWAQDGYNLYITRTITTASGSRRDRVSTVYKPWRAVYEMGPRILPGG